MQDFFFLRIFLSCADSSAYRISIGTFFFILVGKLLSSYSAGSKPIAAVLRYTHKYNVKYIVDCKEKCS